MVDQPHPYGTFCVIGPALQARRSPRGQWTSCRGDPRERSTPKPGTRTKWHLSLSHHRSLGCRPIITSDTCGPLLSHVAYRLPGSVMLPGAGLALMRAAAVIPVVLLVLFTGLLWLLGLLCGRERRSYVTELSRQAMSAVGGLMYGPPAPSPLPTTQTDVTATGRPGPFSRLASFAQFRSFMKSCALHDQRRRGTARLSAMALFGGSPLTPEQMASIHRLTDASAQ
jgi:hypothetical protein